MTVPGKCATCSESIFPRAAVPSGREPGVVFCSLRCRAVDDVPTPCAVCGVQSWPRDLPHFSECDNGCGWRVCTRPACEAVDHDCCCSLNDDDDGHDDGHDDEPARDVDETVGSL
jgi:hypothetical protein